MARWSTEAWVFHRGGKTISRGIWASVQATSAWKWGRRVAAVIEFQHVTKIYKRMFSEEKLAALSDLSFEMAPGQVCAFLGPNGAGKTTSISMLMGFFFPTSGEIRVFGKPPGDLAAKEQIGFLPENFAFHKFLTAPKLLRFHLQLAGRDPGTAGNQIPELLAKVKLNGYENLKIGKYSRGMVQRIGIAQALLCNPQLVVLDEPTSGLRSEEH